MYQIIFTFLLGLIVGSFLNVVLSFLSGERSNLLDRSHCNACQKALKWYELVPLLSFIVLGGKCRSCRAVIPKEYFLVELITGILFVYAFSLVGWTWQLGPLVYIMAVLVVTFVYDWKTMLVSDLVVGPAVLVTGLMFWHNWPSTLGAVVFFALLVLVSGERWMGWGDVEIVALMGFLLAWPALLYGLTISFVLGTIYGIVLLCRKKVRIRSPIPFGPFLVIGTILGLSPKIIEMLERLLVIIL